MLTQHGCHEVAHCHQGVIGVGRQHGIEHAQHPVQHGARTVQGDYRILKHGLIIVLDNGLHLGIMLLDSLTDSGFIVGSGNAVEGHCPTRRPEWSIKYIVLDHI